MAQKYGTPVGSDANQAIPLSRVEVPGGLTLTKISGGAVQVTAADTGDSISSITVGGTEILGATVSWATSDLVFIRLLVRQINSYSATSGYWATHDGTDKIFIWPLNCTSANTGAVVTTASGFSPTDTNMNSYQAFVAATGWNSGNEGADAFADTGMYQVGFDFSHLYAIDGATVTTAKCAELDITTEDQILSAYIGSRGVHTIGAAAVKKTLSVLGCMDGQMRLFLQSAAAQNAVYSLRIY